MVVLCFTTSSFSIHKFQMIPAEIVQVYIYKIKMMWGGEKREREKTKKMKKKKKGCGSKEKRKPCKYYNFKK